MNAAAAGAWAAAIMTLGAAVAPAQGERDLPDLLRAAAKYVADYERQVSAVVSEETYVQRYAKRANTERGTRSLRSDMLVINDDVVGWVGFRDVYEVDGVAVRDRDERLGKLFMDRPADAWEQAVRITNESARYNLVSEIIRTINIPMQALRFIAADRQDRSRFTLEDVRTVDGVRVAVVRFDELELPRVIQTPDEAPAHGRFWIEPGSGRIVRTELRLETGSVTKGVLMASVHATYAYVEKVAMWMPVSMSEEYRISGTLVEGRATYANFRKFTVDTTTIIK